jgi:hypothetical protein
VCIDIGCSVSKPADMASPRRRHVLIQAIDK